MIDDDRECRRLAGLERSQRHRQGLAVGRDDRREGEPTLLVVMSDANLPFVRAEQVHRRRAVGPGCNGDFAHAGEG